MRKDIESAILIIQEGTAYRYIGKERHYGKTYYVFQDQCDYINYRYYPAAYIREVAKEYTLLLKESK